MHAPRHVRVWYCTNEVRSFMLELPVDGLLLQGSMTLSASEFEYLARCLSDGRMARIDAPDCWSEYEKVDADAA